MMLNTLFTVIINLPLNIILISELDYIGAALASALSYVLLSTLHTVLLYRTI